MKLDEALGKIWAPQGTTSVISAMLSGDFDPVAHSNAVGASLAAAREKLAAVNKAQDAATSDWSWWGYEGERAYWAAVVSLLEAADLVGADNLPDVAAPNPNGVLMDVAGNVEDFGSRVLTLAKRRAAEASLQLQR